MTLRTFIEYHFGSMKGMNEKMNWVSQQCNRYYHKTPERFMLYCADIRNHTNCEVEDLVEMITHRRNEINEVLEKKSGGMKAMREASDKIKLDADNYV